MLINKNVLFSYDDGSGNIPNPAVLVGPEPNTDVVPTKSASFNSAAIALPRIKGYFVGLSWPATGAPNGTLKLQACIDPSLNNDDTADSGLVNWYDLPLLTTALTGSAGTVAFQDPDAMYGWVRVSWTRTSGNLLLTARIQIKGIG